MRGNLSSYYLGLLLIATTTLLSGSSYAQPALLIGIDKGTREWAEKLENNLPDVFQRAIAQALPLIDKSVQGYIAQLDKRIHDNISDGVNKLQCSAEGVIRNAQSALSASVANVLYFGDNKYLIPSNTPRHLKDVDDAVTMTRSSILNNTTAHQITIGYDDLIHFMSAVICAAKIDHEPLASEIMANLLRITNTAMEWSILDVNGDCNLPGECVVKRRLEIQNLLKTEDPRDVAAAQAAQAFAKLPSDPTTPIIHSKLDIIPFESILMNERTIERSIAGEKLRRLQKAADSWENATKLRDSANFLLATETAEVNDPSDPSTGVDWQLCISSRCGDIKKLTNQALSAALYAAYLDSQYNDDYTKMKQSITPNIAAADSLYAKAQQREQNRIQQIRMQMQKQIHDMSNVR